MRELGTRRRWLMVLLGALGILLLAVAPALLSGYWVRALTSAFMYAVFTQGINIIAGYCGYPAFGNVAFFGIGAYTTAVLMANDRVPFAPSVAVGIAIAALTAVLIGPAILRLKGGYFAIGTLGIMFTLRDLVTVAEFTGGASGIRLPVVPWSAAVTNLVFYYCMAGLMVVGIFVTLWIAKSKFGYGLRAVRDSSEAAEMLGINTTRYRVLAWALSAMFAAAAGGVYAYWIGFLEPPYAFDVTIAVKGFLMMLVGGAGTVLGPVVGAIFMEVLSEVIWGKFVKAHFFVLGLVVVLVALYMPGGIRDIYRVLGPMAAVFRGRTQGGSRLGRTA